MESKSEAKKKKIKVCAHQTLCSFQCHTVHIFQCNYCSISSSRLGKSHV